MKWLLDCEDRKEQRHLPHHVTINYATMAQGNFARGLIPPGMTFASWDAFAGFLRPEFKLQNAECPLFQETGH